MGRDRLFYAFPDGTIMVVNTEEGQEILRKKIDPAVWDGLAIVPERLLVSTTTGKILCLGTN